MDLFSTETLTSGSNDVGTFADLAPAGSDFSYLLSPKEHISTPFIHG